MAVNAKRNQRNTTRRKNDTPKRKILRLDSSKRKLNSSKEVEGVTYYSLEDVETIAQVILSELASDPTIGVSIEPSETGVVLNCIPEDGDEYTVDVDLNTETLADEEPIEEEPLE